MGRGPLIAKLAATLVVAASIACSSEPAPPTQDSAASDESAGVVEPEAEAEALPLLGSGEASVQVRGSHLNVRANQAARTALLEALAAGLGFDLRLAPEAGGSKVSVQLADVTVAEALAEILVGQPYAAHYGVEPGSGRHLLRRLEVGEGASAGLAAVDAPEAAASADRAAQAAPGRVPTESGAGLSGLLEAAREQQDTPEAAAARAEADADQADWIERLASEDPEEREYATSEIAPRGAGVEALLGVLRDDPDPGVRRSAVQRLEDGSGAEVVEGLTDALSDRDPGVVREAIEALAFVGDESVAERLFPLLDSSDPDVRKAAADALATLK